MITFGGPATGEAPRSEGHRGGPCGKEAEGAGEAARGGRGAASRAGEGALPCTGAPSLSAR